MIKRYDIYIQRDFEDDHCFLDYDENKTGKWVEYDDIKHLIPDNRVTEETFKKFLEKYCEPLYPSERDILIKVAKRKGWIKPEVSE